MHPFGGSELKKIQPAFRPSGGEWLDECGDSTWRSWTFWRMVPNHRGTTGGVVWLICFSCFASQLIGLLLDYITMLDLCNIFEFCKRSRLVSAYEGNLLNFFIFWWQIRHESGQCFSLRCNFIPTVNRLTLLRKKKCCLVSILNLFFEIQSHVYMIFYSRSIAGWFIILIFHGRIMFITIEKKNVALFLF